MAIALLFLLLALAFAMGGSGDDGDPPEPIDGTNGNDTLIGTDGDDLIRGLDGDDLLVGGNGDDTLYGGNGNDTLDGGRGFDRVFGGAGDDVIILPDQFAGNIFGGPLAFYDGGTGSDTLDGSHATRGLTVHLYDSIDQIDNRVFAHGRISDVNGGAAAFSDIDTILTGDGDDGFFLDSVTIPLTIMTGGGNDTVHLNHSAGHRIDLGSGDDTIRVTGLPAAVSHLSGGDGQDVLIVNALGVVDGRLTLAADGSGVVRSGDEDRILLDGFDIFHVDGIDFDGSNARQDLIVTSDKGLGDSLVLGGSGNDFLSAAIVSGGDGDDTLHGFHMTGGDGADTFVVDTLIGGTLGDPLALITDFTPGTDTLSITAYHYGTVPPATEFTQLLDPDTGILTILLNGEPAVLLISDTEIDLSQIDLTFRSFGP